PRARLLVTALDARVDLETRHELVVEGLQAIHVRSLGAARGALAEAAAAGALREIDRLWAINAIVAELDPAWISRLEADPAIAEIVLDRRLTLGRSDPLRASRIRPGAAVDPVAELTRIRVPQVWAQGITGIGALVANVDAGVNGEDDDFGNRWRGRFTGSESAWYAPIPLTVFPEEDDSFGPSGHGTATMGIMAGGEATFGVAFDATWMAGDAFEDGEGFVSNVLKIFQWLMDPDGDPASRADVPDVVNNSYGLEDLNNDGLVRCDRIFNDAIDALEAAGAIVVWSAGNLGDSGVTSPANRGDSPLNAFSVGGVDDNDERTSSSGRGPSTCGGANAIKPEVVAPSTSVTSRSRQNRTVSFFSGTSFSTPMVSGIFALMRSKNPTITPEAAKQIVLETARDLGASGDDSDTGRGLVDAAAALARVNRPAQPLARLTGFRHPSASVKISHVPAGLALAGVEEALLLRPGASASLVPHLTNHGPALPATTATLTSPTPGVTVTRASVALAPAATGVAFSSVGGASFGVEVSGAVLPGSDIVLLVTVQGAPVGPFRVVLKAGVPVAGTFATHTRGRVRLSVTNFGALGYYTGFHDGDFELRGEGFRFPADGPNWLFHAGFVAATGPTRVSDALPYGEDTQNATDWIPLAGFPIVMDEAAGGQRISAGYDDRRATQPLDLRVRQESFAFSASGEDAFVIVQYILTNAGTSTLAGVRTGFFADWDLPDSSDEPRETAGFDPGRRLGFVEGTRAGQPALGVVALDDVPIARVSYAVLERDEIIASTVGNPTGVRTPVPAAAPGHFEGEFSDAEKWNALSSGQTDTSVTTPEDLWQLIGIGPLTLAAGATDTVAFALVAGTSRAALQTAAETARAVYFQRILGLEPPPPPPPVEATELRQNYPNPFRFGSPTTIEFGIPEGTTGALDLAVYDLLGRRVRTLADRSAVAGEQAVTWDGRDDTGQDAPPGVYVIRLVVGGVELAVRALLVP
ncbi:MAG: S8 family serine peptidase, partial [Gemmatimonadota bacterium]